MFFKKRITLKKDRMNQEVALDYITYSALFGIFITVYSTYVKWMFKKNPNYRALCDISENMSCTRVLASKYGSGFGIVGKLVGEKSSLNISNSILGCLFYVIQIGLSNNPIFTIFRFHQ